MWYVTYDCRHFRRIVEESIMAKCNCNYGLIHEIDSNNGKRQCNYFDMISCVNQFIQGFMFSSRIHHYSLWLINFRLWWNTGYGGDTNQYIIYCILQQYIDIGNINIGFWLAAISILNINLICIPGTPFQGLGYGWPVILRIRRSVEIRTLKISVHHHVNHLHLALNKLRYVWIHENMAFCEFEYFSTVTKMWKLLT